MKRELLVEREGRTFVLCAGLMDLAHERGQRDGPRSAGMRERVAAAITHCAGLDRSGGSPYGVHGTPQAPRSLAVAGRSWHQSADAHAPEGQGKGQGSRGMARSWSR